MADLEARLLLTIVDEDKEKIISNIYRRTNTPLKFILHGNGTATSTILSYFGLTATKKSIVAVLTTKNYQEEIIKTVDKKIGLEKKGHGICISIPLSSSNMHIYKKLKEIPSIERNDYMTNTKYHLIVTIVKEGLFENVMDIARKNGAKGGTLVHGRGLGQKEIIKFLDFVVEPEKDVIMMVVDKKVKNKVMKSISDSFGLNTIGNGICFSMPVDEAVGLEIETNLK